MPSLKIPGYGLTTPGPIVVAGDPGGTELVRVGGSIRAAGNVVTTDDSASFRAYNAGAAALAAFLGTYRAWVGSGATTDAALSSSGDIVFFTNASSSVRGRVKTDGSLVWGTDPGGADLVRIGGALRASGGVVVPSVVSLDTSGNLVAIANNATATLTLGSYVSFEISEITVAGNTARVTVTNHVLTIDGQTGADYSTASGTASKTNLTFAAGVLTIQNKLGASAEYRLSVRKRA